MAIGQKIAYLRERRGMSQRDLAEKAGVSQPAICQIETGATKPRLETVFRIANALDVCMPELFDP